ncbi:MAG: methyltransferase family protein [Promethearchaeota archaeon]
MFQWWAIITIFLICYDATYILSHAPLDLIMLCRKKLARYPSPNFPKIHDAFFYTIASYLFLLYIYIAPLIAYSKGVDIYSTIALPSPLSYSLSYSILLALSNFIRIIGMVIMAVGVFLAILGRFGRGLYLNHENPRLTTTWGHRIIRHPEYFMYITGFIGLPLLTLNYWLIILVVGILPYYRIAKYEENGLIVLFGEEFIDYQQKVGMFFPKLNQI